MQARYVADRSLLLSLWLGASRLDHSHAVPGHRAVSGLGQEVESALPNVCSPRGGNLGALPPTSTRTALLGSGCRADPPDPRRTA